jgi:beta-glucosidase
MKQTLILLISLVASCSGPDNKVLVKSDVIDNKVDSLMQLMTLEEKIGQLLLYSTDFSSNITGGGAPKSLDWYKSNHVGNVLNAFDEDLLIIQKELGENSRLGIPVLTMIDAVNGHSFYPGSTIFPTQLALSQTWNPELLYEVGRVTAVEMAATGINLNYGPGLDISRDLRWGRVGETLGEDPYLTGILGSARIKGQQGEDLSKYGSVAACAKHFVGYGETIGGRDATASNLSERMLRINHLPPFKKAIEDAEVATVMAAYHSVLGVPASANSWLLNDLLRKEYGFDGFVISDWENYSRLMDTHLISKDSIDAAIEIISAGNDMPMSSYQLPYALKTAVEEGLLKESVIDSACNRVLTLKFKLGLFDNESKLYPSPQKHKILANKEHLNIALEAAYQSVVLLENKKDVLPLREETIRSIALVGPNADNIVAQLGDWSLGFRGQGPWQDEVTIRTKKHSTIRMGLEKRIGNVLKINYAMGSSIQGGNKDEISKAVKIAKKSDVIVAVVGDDRSLTGEQQDRAIMNLTGNQIDMLTELSMLGKPMITILLCSKPLMMSQVAEISDVLLLAINPGMRGGDAIAGLLFGDRSPSGKLSVSIPHHIGQMPAHYNQPPGWHGVGYYVDLDSITKTPLYSFGYGLSYTKFEYKEISIENPMLTDGKPLKGSFSVKNIGKTKGVEISQIYLEDKIASVTRPVRTLKGFKRISLEPGEEKKVNFEIPFIDLAILNPQNKWVVEPGKFEVYIGSSANIEDLYLNQEFSVVK